MVYSKAEKKLRFFSIKENCRWAKLSKNYFNDLSLSINSILVKTSTWISYTETRIPKTAKFRKFSNTLRFCAALGVGLSDKIKNAITPDN